MKTRFRSVVLAACLFMLAALNGFGQNLDKIPQVTPIMPEAASMFKVLERPIGSYTGTVPINFPLLTFTSGPLSNNLDLSYNSTGGIRVEEIASSTGLGFSLSGAGGVITQQVRDLPDDWDNGMVRSPYKPSNFNYTNMMDIWRSTLPYELDLEPDFFYYNFNGRSGKFIFKEDGSIVMAENSGIKIQPYFGNTPNQGLTGFIITDEAGNKYNFGGVWVENTNSYIGSSGMGSSNPAFASKSWYLVEASDMNDENKLTYSYVGAGGMVVSHSGGFLKSLTFGTVQSFNTSPEFGSVITTSNEYLISKIEGRSGYVLFNSSAGRLDGYGRKINSIEAYDSTGVLKKKIKFNYSYFSLLSPTTGEKRLKLVNFSEHAIGVTDSITHRFEYDELQNLPTRLSNSVDIWGFYNGQYNSSYFPNLFFRYLSNEIRHDQFANRHAIAGYAQANILKKITYPTGGTREFEYEGNTALTYTNDQHLLDPAYYNGQGFNRSDFDIYATYPMPSMQETFSINSGDGGAVFTYQLSHSGWPCNDYYVKLFGGLTTPGDLYGGYEIDLIYNNDSWDWNLSNGHYRIEVYQNSTSCAFDNLQGSWSESNLSTAMITTPYGEFNRNNINVGGVRIKEIKDYDPVSAKTNKTSYLYKLYSTDSTFTSGVLITPVNMISYENPGSWDGQYIAINTAPCYPLSAQGGSYVVYPEVRTIESGNGRTDRKYSYVPDNIESGYPIAPPQDNSGARGNLEEERIYNQAGTLLRKTTNVHWGAAGGHVMGVKVKPYYYDVQDQGGKDREWPRNENEVPWHWDTRTFFTTLSSSVPRMSIDSVYDGGNVFVTKTVYSYIGHNNQYLLKNKKTYINGTAAKSTTLKYSFTPNGDFVFGLSAGEQSIKTILKDQNYLLPIEVVDSIIPSSGPGSILSGVKQSFGVWGINRIHLNNLKEYSSATNYKETILSAYDSKGNLLEKYQVGSPKEVYLWGYNANYPVAKIIGSDYATVSALVTSSILNNPASDVALRTHLSGVRTNLATSLAQVSTYTYSPLIGMTSTTDARGVTSFYEYDNFSRLKVIKDLDGKVLKSFQYHYKQ